MAETIQFCDAAVNTNPCGCSANGVDAECTFRICGYPPGHYRGSNLPLFAARVAEEIKSWRPRYLVSTEFVGLADGTIWGNEKQPKPQPLSELVERCLLRASRNHARAISKLSEHDYLDAELALLRGCALEEELAQNISKFEFDYTPGFSFDSRKERVSDPNMRAAELKLFVAKACGRLAS